MSQREKILSGIKGSEEKELAARSLDLADKAMRTRSSMVSDFYSPYHLDLVMSVLERVAGISAVSDGGFDYAERKRVIICPDFLDPGQEDSGLAFLETEGNLDFSKISHRDVLGSILGLGLRREKIGDVLFSSGAVQVVVSAEVADFVRLNLSRIGKNKVTMKEIARDELSPPEPEFKEIKSTVPSLRLDVITAAAFGLSRGRASKEINAQRVFLNWKLCTKQTAAVEEGDMLSLRGKGRALVGEISGRTKKGRLSVLLKRYI